MINAFPTIVSGLMKRPPTEHVATLDPSVTADDASAVRMIDRDALSKYILIGTSGDLVMYDQYGVEQTITFPDGKSYLPTEDMWKKLRFVTVADTTFILNTAVTVTASDLPETRTDPTARASVFIRQAVASTTYAIYVDGVLAGSTSTNANTEASNKLEGTADIAGELAADLTSRGWANVSHTGATVSFDVTSGAILSVLDQYGGAAMTFYTDTVQEFSDLPPNEVEGRIVQVAGNLDATDSDTYWVRFENGVWFETVGYNAGRRLDASTMPHALRKTGPSSFEFREWDWNARVSGDDDSNPDPTFVDAEINGMFLFKGRLGLLSEENLIMSAVGIFEDFYRTTVVTLVDSDPIDVASATGRVSTLYHAASFSDELVLFSDKQQFRVSSGQVLSPETVGITNSTSFPCSLYVAPVSVGASSYFISDGATHSLAREIFVDSDRETVNGEDIAVQVPSYIPKNIRSLTASSTADVFLAHSADTPNDVYVYKWYETDRKKIQSAWCKWTFENGITIVGMGFLNNFLYLVYKVGDSVRIDRMLVGPQIDKPLLLDHQFEASDCTVNYDSGTDKTTILTPYDHPDAIKFYVYDAGEIVSGEELEVTKVADGEYEIDGEVTVNFIAGFNYEFRYDFSTQYLREETSDGEAAIQDGRLQLRYFSLIYTDTSYFEAHVTPTNGETKVSIFNGRTLADPDNQADVIPQDTGEFKFPIFAQNEDVEISLINNQPYRCAFGSVEWSANYRPKARRIR
jgi:hypothetical protein